MNDYILLIEDDDDHAELAEFYISDFNSEIEIVRLSDGEQAMNYISTVEAGEKVKPWLILLDLKVPKYDGHEILAKIKSSEDLLQCPVVVFTTSNSDKDVEKAFAANVNSYVLKPTEADRYGEAIHEILNYWEHDQHRIVQSVRPG